MIVVDASVPTNALVDDGELGQIARAELRRDDRWSAPQHLIVETFSAVRRRVLGRTLSTARGAEAVASLARLRIDLLDVASLVEQVWAMHEDIGAHDTAHVAAA